MPQVLFGRAGGRHGLCAVIIVCFNASLVTALGWGDITSDIISDFGPLLALFGEAPSKQFLSQSMDLADEIMIAMVPIGVLAIVSSAIRIARSSALRNMIGRAEESAEVAEKELLCSTSKNVCEIRSGRKFGKVVREEGKKDIIGLVYDDNKAYDFDTAIKHELLVLRPYRPSRAGKSKPKDVDRLPPNLTLNIHGPLLSPSEKWIYATIAFLVQAGVLVYDAVITYHQPYWITTGSQSIGFPMTCVGTMFLCAGIFVCAHVIRASTDTAQYVHKTEARTST
jgi:hypothetical protein